VAFSFPNHDLQLVRSLSPHKCILLDCAEPVKSVAVPRRHLEPDQLISEISLIKYVPNRKWRAKSEPREMLELDVSGIMGVSLENASQRSGIQGSDQADVDGMTEKIIA